jgi:uncharacterized membrane protein YbhN (UPF0104 family)
VLRRWWRPILVVAGIGLAVVTLRGRLPDLPTTWATVRAASPAWLLAAVAAQVVSMGAFAEQQRQLLSAFGVRMAAPVSLAITYARSAMTTALPGGSAVSAGYAFRQFRSHGATQPIAAAVMLLSGVASVVGLTLVYAAEALAWLSWSATLSLVVGAAGAVLLAVVAGRHWSRRCDVAASSGALGRPSPVRRLVRNVREAASLARTVPATRWLRVVGLAMLNWLTDLACLLAAMHAVGLTVPVRTVATAYVAIQLIRQVPVTPGGIGVIEASLLLALTTAGAPAIPAAAAVLVYRLLSCWAILPIGLICWNARKLALAAAARLTYA